VEEWVATATRREAERAALTATLADPSTAEGDKMPLRCAYIQEHRKSLFSCPRCWLQRGLCMCGECEAAAAVLAAEAAAEAGVSSSGGAAGASAVSVAIHVHHSEWGKASNTGCLLPLILGGPESGGGEVLMAGHAPHDARLAALLAEPGVTTAVLWPSPDALTPEELLAVAAAETGGRVRLVAVDATWANARRMKSCYPPGALQVRLPSDMALGVGGAGSLLRPIKAYAGDYAANGRTSTLEAVAALLRFLGGGAPAAAARHEALLRALRSKVDRVRLQACRAPIYGEVDRGEADARLLRRVRAAPAPAGGGGPAAAAEAMAAVQLRGGDEGSSSDGGDGET
jgi:DTW domain-containing protein YfiP